MFEVRIVTFFEPGSPSYLRSDLGDEAPLTSPAHSMTHGTTLSRFSDPVLCARDRLVEPRGPGDCSAGKTNSWGRSVG